MLGVNIVIGGGVKEFIEVQWDSTNLGVSDGA